MNLPVPSGLAVRPRTPRDVAARSRAVVLLAARLAPVVRASLVAAAAGLGVELALRAVATRALAALGRDAARAVTTSTATTRTVVTEFVIRERVRRVR